LPSCHSNLKKFNLAPEHFTDPEEFDACVPGHPDLGLTPLSNKDPDINPLQDVITIPGAAKGFMHIECLLLRCGESRAIPLP